MDLLGGTMPSAARLRHPKLAADCSNRDKRDRQTQTGRIPPMANFMFATGIENSYPTIQNGRYRVDQMEVCGHYKHWRTDFDLVQ
jgi:hypothetical protein